MAYATVKDVEDRLGYSLDEAGSKSLELFLEDFSESLDFAVESAGYQPADIAASLKTALTARRGMRYAQIYDVDPTVASYSKTVGDNSTSQSNRAYNVEDLLDLSRSDFKRLGLRTFKFSSFEREFHWG